MLQRRHVVRDFENVVQRDARRLLEIEEEEVRQGRLRPLDLRGEDGFLPDVRVEEEGAIGQERRDAVEPTEGQRCRLQGGLELVELEGGHGWQVVRDEGAYGLPTLDPYLVAARLASLQGSALLFSFLE